MTGKILVSGIAESGMSLISLFLADCVPREFHESEQKLGSAVATYPGKSSTVAAYRVARAIVLQVYDNEGFPCADMRTKELPDRGLSSEDVFRTCFRTGRHVDEVRGSDPPFHEFAEDGLMAFVYPGAEGIRTCCFAETDGSELAVAERKWADISALRSTEMKKHGILPPGYTPIVPQPSLAWLVFGRDYDRPYFDNKYRRDVAKEYVVGEDGVFSGVIYRDKGGYVSLIFSENGKIVASQRTRGLPNPGIITGYDLFIKAFLVPERFDAIRRRCESAGVQWKQVTEGGLRFVLSRPQPGMLHAAVFNAQGRALYRDYRAIDQYDAPRWERMIERGLDMGPRVPAEPDPTPVEWPAISVLRRLFSYPFKQDYYEQKLSCKPVQSHGGEISIAIFRSSGRGYDAYVFCENGDFFLNKTLSALPPKDLTGYHVMVKHFGRINLTPESFRRQFADSRRIGEFEECGLRYMTAVRDAVCLSIFSPDGGCIHFTTRKLLEWSAEARKILVRMRLLV